MVARLRAETCPGDPTDEADRQIEGAQREKGKAIEHAEAVCWRLAAGLVSGPDGGRVEHNRDRRRSAGDDQGSCSSVGAHWTTSPEQESTHDACSRHEKPPPGHHGEAQRGAGDSVRCEQIRMNREELRMETEHLRTDKQALGMAH